MYVEPTSAREAETVQEFLHDISSPLTALNFLAQHLLYKDQKSGELLGLICRQLEELTARLVEQSGASRFVCAEPVSLAEFLPAIQNLLELKRIEYINHHFRLFTPMQASNLLGLKFSARLLRLMSVISNILNNAVEAQLGGGVIDIEINLEDSWLNLTVLDRGPQINQKVLHLLQEGQSFSTKSHSGRGRGLIMARQALEEWGGQMRFLPNEPHGLVVGLKLKLINNRS